MGDSEPLHEGVRAEAVGSLEGVRLEELVVGRRDWAAQSFSHVPQRQPNGQGCPFFRNCHTSGIEGD